MASTEQKELANYIKSVHHSLRVESKKRGVKEAWQMHCKQKDVLEKYAKAMQQLATGFWKTDDNSESRINWIIIHCKKYFLEGGIAVEREKEWRKSNRIFGMENSDAYIGHTTSPDKIYLLDVGSCYNPFGKFSLFEVFAIDLTPACSDVLQCDFINAEVCACSVDYNIEEHIKIKHIPQNMFNVVVFSLLLEYIPSPFERFVCCKKAYQCLKPEGLLFIVTPDSKHATANASLMKQWRITLAHLGFCRIYYEKLPHIHCMAFRKDINARVMEMWADNMATKFSKVTNEINPGYSLAIPQDNEDNYSDEDCIVTPVVKCDIDYATITEMFAQLPNF